MNRRRLHPSVHAAEEAMNYDGVALTVHIVGIDQKEPDLKPFRMNRPCYLSDTLNLQPDSYSNADFTEPTEGNLQINGAKFVSETTYIQTFAVGSLVQVCLALQTLQT